MEDETGENVEMISFIPSGLISWVNKRIGVANVPD